MQPCVSIRWIGFLLCVVVFLAQPARALTNGLALTPPMGWNSWYANGVSVNEALVKSTADQMVASGMKALGYQYVNIDDGWAGYRDTNGVMVADTNRFPSGMKALADYVHSKGLKFGLYTTADTNTCAGFPASGGYEELDAQTYAGWGVDFVKYEFCNLAWFEGYPHQQACAARMGNALLRSGRPMVYSISTLRFEPWMTNYVNLPRGTGDLGHNWASILAHIDYVAQFAAYAGPGAWNDPDVLDIGDGGPFTDAQNKAIFSMWSVLAAPLLAANISDFHTNVLCNAEAIAVDQDPAGIQGICVATNGDLQVWRKPLGGPNSTNLAVVLFNRGTNSGSITANWSDLGLPPGYATVRDLWAHADTGNFTNSYTAVVPPQSVQFLKIVYGTTLPLPAAGTNYLSDLPWLSDYSYDVPVQLDKSGAVTPLSLHGVNYSKGIGTASNTQLSYLLQGTASRFQCDVGLDDIAGPTFGEVEFQVYADGVLLYDSGIMTAASATQHIDLNIRGRNRLTLIVSTVGSINNYGDWAGARILVEAAPAVLNESTVGAAIELAWDAAPGALGYNIFRSTSINGTYVSIGSSTNTTFADSTALGQVTYYYEIATITASGPTTNSVPISAILTPHWVNTLSGAPQSWNANTNWSNTQNFPNTAGRLVVVDAEIKADQTINLSQPITLGSLWIGDVNTSGAYTLAGNGGYFTFNNGTNAAVLGELASSKGDIVSVPINFSNTLNIINSSTNLLTLSGPVSGAGSITVTGGGPVMLAGNNLFSGPLALTQGRLVAGNSAALGGAANGAVVSAGATLDVNGINLGAQPVTVTGSGTDGMGAVVSTSGNAQLSALQTVTLSGDTTFGGTGRWDVRGTNAASPSAVLSTTGHAYKLTKLGPNQVSLVAVNIDPALGDIEVQQGILEIGTATTSLGNPTNTLTVEMGATLSFAQTTNLWNKRLVLNGDGFTAAINHTSGSNLLAGPVVLNGGCVIAVSTGNLGITGPLNGNGSLIKLRSGTLGLLATNNYTGATVITAGTLALAGSGSISKSPGLSIAAGAVLDVSGLNGGGMVLAAGQTLTGAGAVKGNVVVAGQASLLPADPLGTLNFSNSLTFANGASCVLGVTKGPIASGHLTVAGTLTFGGTLAVTNVGGQPFQVGDSFPLFSAGNYAGSFATITPIVPGPGMVWDVSQLNKSGILRLTTGALPFITNFTRLGQSTITTGVGGTLGGAYYVLATTNLSVPLTQWTRVATNRFDGYGGFIFTNAIQLSTSRMFFALQLVKPTAPRLGVASVPGGGVTIFSTNGTPDSISFVLAATNATIPLAQWNRIATNQFDAFGHFTFTDSLAPNVPARFYRLLLP